MTRKTHVIMNGKEHLRFDVNKKESLFYIFHVIS